jgi:hypothetical protein
VWSYNIQDRIIILSSGQLHPQCVLLVSQLGEYLS